MKIGFIVDQFPTISETFILNQITGLIDLGHDVKIYPSKKGQFVKLHEDFVKYKLSECTYYPTIINKCKFKRIFYVLKSLIINLKQGKFKILYAFNFMKFGRQTFDLTAFLFIDQFLHDIEDIYITHFGHVAFKAARLKEYGIKTPNLLFFHGSDIRMGNQTNGKVYERIIPQVKTIFAISDYSINNFKTWRIPSKKLVKHPMGIETYKVIEKTNFQINDNIKVLSVGRLNKIKGYQYSIEAIAKLINSNDFNVTYTIIGEGEEYEHLLEIITKLGINNNVILKGALTQKDIYQEYAKHDIYLHPSLNENTPIAIMEAMAAKLPIIASNVGGVSEMLLGGLAGLLSEPGSSEDIETKMLELIKDETLRKKLVSNAKENVENTYCISKLNKKLETHIIKVVDAER